MRTHITLVVDRSGSMQQIRSDAQGAVNAFLDAQSELPGDCTLTLVDFDAPHPNDDESWLRTLYEGPVAECPDYVLVPRGRTALHDAVGMTIVSTGEYLAAMDASERPDKVIFITQTDGLENASKDWRIDRLQELIKDQTETYSWEFIYLGMGADAWGQGEAMGYGNNTRSAHSAESYVGTYAVVTDHVSTLRAGGQSVMGNVEVADDGTVKR